MLWEPDIVAKITLFPSLDGGHNGPTPADLFGCPIDFEGSYFDIRLDLSNIGSISPGQTVIVPARFLSPELILNRLSIGAEFTLWEGRIIGRGRVEEIHGNP